MDANTTHWNVREDAPSFATAERAVHAILSRKGEDVVVLDLRGHSDVADLFVIATATSEPQAMAIAEGVQDELREAGEKPLSVEGTDRRSWVLLDYVDLIVHVMQSSAREYYAIERLWNDVPRLDVPEDYFADPAVAERHPDLPLVKRAAAREESNETDDA